MQTEERHLALLCSYNGSVFHGWQEQRNAPSVQESLKLAWQELSGEKRSFRGCSRTDAGVSARCHVSDFFSTSRIPDDKIPLALNTKLPAGLSALSCREVPAAFNARFAPLGKLYVYRYWIHRARPSLCSDLLTHCPPEADWERANRFAEKLLGEHEFAAFMDQGSVARRTLRRLERLEFIRREHLLQLVCLGDGFLYHQVRILAGTLLLLAQGGLQEEEILQAMQKKERIHLGPTAPPQGLCLERVFFREELFGGDDEMAYQRMAALEAEAMAEEIRIL